MLFIPVVATGFISSLFDMRTPVALPADIREVVTRIPILHTQVLTTWALPATTVTVTLTKTLTPNPEITSLTSDGQL